MKEAVILLSTLAMIGIVLGLFLALIFTPYDYTKTEINENYLTLKDSNIKIKIDTVEYDGQEYLLFHGGRYFSVCPKKAQ